MSTGAEVLLAALAGAGVDVVFGHPGGAMLPGYDALVASSIRHVLARHEQGAGHMAEGYARGGGRVGVVLSTSGPGATNLMTPLADARLDSVPLVAITGQVGTSGMGKEAFQEADVVSLAAPVTKHSEAVLDPDRIGAAVREALYVASTGRPGPVLLDIPKDVLAAPACQSNAGVVRIPGYEPPGEADVDAVVQAAEALMETERPVVYVGGGVANAGAAAELLGLVDVLHFPVVTTLMARGQFPDRHPAHLGMPGMHGHWTATTAMQKADLILALGARFDDRVTGAIDGFAPNATVVHVDIDPVEMGKNRRADVAVVGDCRAVLQQLLEQLGRVLESRAAPAVDAWWRMLDDWRQTHPLRWDHDEDQPLKPQRVMSVIDEFRPDDSIVVTGVGQHQMWAAQHLSLNHPGCWITSGGLGTMGFCLPAALGAKAARPNTTVVAIDGDGSFQMTLQEMATARAERLPIVCFVLNNGTLGMVQQWQDLFYEGRRSQVQLDPELPALDALARAFGWVDLRCDTVDELHAVARKAFTFDDRPVLVDVRVDPDEMVFPMVATRSSNDEIIESVSEVGSPSR